MKILKKTRFIFGSSYFIWILCKSQILANNSLYCCFWYLILIELIFQFSVFYFFFLAVSFISFVVLSVLVFWDLLFLWSYYFVSCRRREVVVLSKYLLFLCFIQYLRLAFKNPIIDRFRFFFLYELFW